MVFTGTGAWPGRYAVSRGSRLGQPVQRRHLRPTGRIVVEQGDLGLDRSFELEPPAWRQVVRYSRGCETHQCVVGPVSHPQHEPVLDRRAEPSGGAAPVAGHDDPDADGRPFPQDPGQHVHKRSTVGFLEGGQKTFEPVDQQEQIR